MSHISIGLDQDQGQDHGVVVGNQETEENRGKQWWPRVSVSVCQFMFAICFRRKISWLNCCGGIKTFLPLCEMLHVNNGSSLNYYYAQIILLFACMPFVCRYENSFRFVCALRDFI